VNEAYLKGRLVRILREELPGAVVFRHEDKFTPGVPDISVTWHGRTRWIEVKYDRPRSPAKLTATQHAALMALRGYVLTYGVQRATGKKNTRMLLLRSGLSTEWSQFNHRAVAGAIRHSIELEEGVPRDF
jgi:hypothetical protein